MDAEEEEEGTEEEEDEEEDEDEEAAEDEAGVSARLGSAETWKGPVYRMCARSEALMYWRKCDVTWRDNSSRYITLSARTSSGSEGVIANVWSGGRDADTEEEEEDEETEEEEEDAEEEDGEEVADKDDDERDEVEAEVVAGEVVEGGRPSSVSRSSEAVRRACSPSMRR